MNINWKESEGKLKQALKSEHPKGEWWLQEPYARIVRDSNQAHLWLCHCAYNKITGRWHIPMKKNGALWTFLHDQIRKRETGITYCLNIGFKEKRGGFFDTAWTDGRPDFWFVCDAYLEAGELTGDAMMPISRQDCPEDKKILGWDHAKGKHGFLDFEGKSQSQLSRDAF